MTEFTRATGQSIARAADQQRLRAVTCGAILLAMIFAALLPGRALADIRTLADGCFKAYEAGDAAAFPQKIRQVSRGPDTYAQTYKTADGVVAVAITHNKDPKEPEFVCRVDGVERNDPYKVKRITVNWPAAAAKMDALLRRTAKMPGFKVIERQIKEDNLGVSSYILVRCAAPTAWVTIGPSRLSDAGFLTLPLALSALNEATFSYAILSPAYPGIINKHCK